MLAIIYSSPPTNLPPPDTEGGACLEFDMSQLHQILVGDCIDMMRTLPDESVHTCVTSPPYYGLRDYGVEGQIGLEETPAEFIARLVYVFREVRRAPNP